MKVLSKKYAFGSCVLVLMFMLTICSVSSAKEKKPVYSTYPVKWYEGFDLQLYTGGKPPETLDDIKRLLQAKWGKKPFHVESGDGDVERGVNNCGEFFKAQKDELYPVANIDRGPYSLAGLCCIAAQLILDAKPAKKSYIENLKIDGSIAKYLPADVEYIISPDQPRHKSGSWAEVEKVKVDKVAKGEVTFSSRGADHSVSKIAVGDFNGDGLQDILLLIGHSVKEGTHFENYLYILTRSGPNDILKTIRRYNALED